MPVKATPTNLCWSQEKNGSSTRRMNCLSRVSKVYCLIPESRGARLIWSSHLTTVSIAIPMNLWLQVSFQVPPVDRLPAVVNRICIPRLPLATVVRRMKVILGEQSCLIWRDGFWASPTEGANSGNKILMPVSLHLQNSKYQKIYLVTYENLMKCLFNYLYTSIQPPP